MSLAIAYMANIPLNGFYETVTHAVYWLAIQHHAKMFWVLVSKKIWAPKITYFRRLSNSMATLRVNISGEEHDADNRETALETTKSPLHRPEIS